MPRSPASGRPGRPGLSVSGVNFSGYSRFKTLTLTYPFEGQKFYPGSPFEVQFFATGLTGDRVRIEYDMASSYVLITPGLSVTNRKSSPVDDAVNIRVLNPSHLPDVERQRSRKRKRLPSLFQAGALK